MYNPVGAGEYTLEQMAHLGREKTDLIFSKTSDLSIINREKIIELLN